MMNRLLTGIALLAVSLPLAACGDGNSGNSNTGGAGGTTGGTSNSGGTSNGAGTGGTSNGAGTGGTSDSGGTGASAGSPGSGGSAGAAMSAWAGHTYLLSLAKIDWTVPRGVGKDLFGVAPAFIIKVEGTGDNLTATVGTGLGTYQTDPNDTTTKQAVTPAQAMQDPCGVTTKFTFSASGAPKSTIGPSQIRMFVLNNGAMPPLQITADVYNLKFTDILPNGSTPSTTGTLEAMMDFRQLYVLFASLGPTRTPQSVCDSFSSAYTSPDCMDDSCKVKCQACPDGQPFCLSVKAEEIGAVEAPNLTVTEVTEASRPATCADSPKPM